MTPAGQFKVGERWKVKGSECVWTIAEVDTQRNKVRGVVGRTVSGMNMERDDWERVNPPGHDHQAFFDGLYNVSQETKPTLAIKHLKRREQ